MKCWAPDRLLLSGPRGCGFARRRPTAVRVGYVVRWRSVQCVWRSAGVDVQRLCVCPTMTSTCAAIRNFQRVRRGGSRANVCAGTSRRGASLAHGTPPASAPAHRRESWVRALEIGTNVGDRRGVDLQRLCVCPTCVHNSNACALSGPGVGSSVCAGTGVGPTPAPRPKSPSGPSCSSRHDESPLPAFWPVRKGHVAGSGLLQRFRSVREPQCW